MHIGYTLAAALVVLAAVYGICAYLFDSMFSPNQMIERWGKRGIPLALHGGFWGDLFVLPPLCHYLIRSYDVDLESNGLFKSIAIGFALTAGNHLNLCLNQKVPDPLGWQHEWFSGTIFVHFLYMWLASTVLVQAAFFTPGISSSVVAVVCLIVAVHMMFGTHIPLGMANRYLQLDYLPEFLRLDSLVMAIGIWVAMAGIALYAGGREAMQLILVAATIAIGLIAYVMLTTKPLLAK